MGVEVSPHRSWRFTWLMAAPHRLGFFSAAVVMSMGSLWWCVELMLRQVGQGTLADSIPSTFVHAMLMTYGFMPLFFSGFLFTAGPRWLQMPEGDARTIRPGVLLLLSAWPVWLIGAHASAGVAAVGLGLAVLGWGWLALHFARMVRASRAHDKVHATIIALASAVGVSGLLMAAIGVASGQWAWLRWSAWLGLWWFIVPIYVAVGHRMIPFFTAAVLPTLDAWRPNWLLWAMLGAVVLQGVWFGLDAVGADAGSWLLIRSVCSMISGVLLVALAVRWGLVQSLKVRLLAMLHLGFVWLGIAFLLDGLHAALLCLGMGGGAALASLHALTMGFLGSVLFAMATRVSCGHGGRTLAADNLAWGIFWLVQLAVVGRLAGTWSTPLAAIWILLAALAWAVAVLTWSIRYGRWFGRPRADGRPG